MAGVSSTPAKSANSVTRTPVAAASVRVRCGVPKGSSAGWWSMTATARDRSMTARAWLSREGVGRSRAMKRSGSPL